MIERERDRIIIPASILGEIDCLLRARLGIRALLQFLSDVEHGAFVIENITSGDLARCAAVIKKYSDVDLGLCDASVIAVAERLSVLRILTVDVRDFRLVRSNKGKPFVLLPADGHA